ncbi:enterochelin esterase-like enzyme [Streptacidiphilus sp. MAP12-20]|uniref:alpha/beta hydrolase n=1 Tax=Streptacidiphilus sp. MAP12-20 TaxID=3156299 RepID=UPI0035154CC9
MSLTGTAFFYLLIIATIVAVAGTLVLWGMIRGPQWLRWTSRLAMIGVCQLTAIAVVAVWINNANGLYTSWADLFGQSQQANIPIASQDRNQGLKFSNDRAGFQRAGFYGKASGMGGEMLVWTPPQYNDPQFRSYDFPVIMLLPGYPGSPWSWIGGGGVPGVLEQMMANGTLKPAIVVIPSITPSGQNTDCTDVGKAKNGTWLGVDVPNMIKSQFRVIKNAHGWGLVGYSTGGYCAPKLTLQYPTTFGAAVGLSPDDFRGDPGTIRDPKIRATQNPLAIAARAKNADVSILLATSKSDRFSTPANVEALRKAVKWPVQMPAPIVLKDGGHNWNTWRGLYPVIFPWLNDQLMAPQMAAAPPTSSPSPVVKSAASTISLGVLATPGRPHS